MYRSNPTSYRLIVELFTAYYHQDFDVDAGSDQGALRLFVEGWREAYREELRCELSALADRPEEEILELVQTHAELPTNHPSQHGGARRWILSLAAYL